MVPEFSTLAELLLWIASGGGAAILVGRVVSLWLENMTWWHPLPQLVKKVVPAVLAVIFAILAESALTVDLGSILGPYAPLVGTLLLALWNWLATQEQYIRTKETAYAAKAKMLEA
jgi:ABC-type uncharacterized transport system YnjBCD permease subunit